MLNSRSTASRNRWLLLVVLLLGFARTADADRKRIVILPLDGDEKAEKIHAALVKLVKESHTVVKTDKWESTASDMSASKVNDANIKKVAKKLKVDGVIEGTVTKRRDEYVIKLKLHSGADGKVAGKVDTKAEDTKLTGAKKDIKSELISAIDDLKSVRGEDDEDEKPKKAKKGEDEDEKPKKAKKGEDEDEKPKKAKKGEDEDEKPKKGKDEDKKPSKFGAAAKMEKGDDAKGKKDEDEKPKKAKKGEDEDEKPKKAAKGAEEEDENPNPKPKKGKQVAKKGDGDDDDNGGEVRGGGDVGGKLSASEATLPGNRAIEATVGASFNARRLAWKADGDLATGTPGSGRPPNYNGVPAPGAVVDITAYPMAFGHKAGGGQVKNIGITAMFDRALLISSKLGDGTKLKTAASRYLFGAIYRYPLSPSFVVGGQLGYGRQSFQIQQGADLPNVNYTMIEPGAFMRVGVGKMTFGLDLAYQLISGTGQMTKGEFYGKASVGGLDLGVGLDYPLSKSLFARGAVNLERIGYKFDGSGMLTTTRDTDADQDVQGATDLYFGVALTVGLLY